MKDKNKRVFEAKQRQEKREKRSPKDQVKFLNKRLGNNVGAKKEREKLKLLIKENKSLGEEK